MRRTTFAVATGVVGLAWSGTSAAEPSRQSCGISPFKAAAAVLNTFDTGDRIGLEYEMRGTSTLECPGSDLHGQTVELRQHARGIGEVDADAAGRPASPNSFRGFGRMALMIGDAETMFRAPLRGSMHCDASSCNLDVETRAHGEGGSVLVLRQRGPFERRTLRSGAIIILDQDGETEVAR